jgi:AP-3 complex subunit mu
VISVPLPDNVRSVADLRPSRGEAHFQPLNHTIEWKVSSKDGASVNGAASLQGTLIGPINVEDAEGDVEEEMNNGSTTNPLLGYYDEDSANVTDPSQALISSKSKGVDAVDQKIAPAKRQKRLQANMALMPRSASVSFNVRGWLASGIKVDSLTIDSKRSTGIPSGMTPYKGVKYVTVSRNGVERRA